MASLHYHGRVTAYGLLTQQSTASPKATETNRSNQIGFAVIFLAVNLHTLRHSLGPIYLAGYAVVAAYSVDVYFRRKKHRDLIDKGSYALAWVLVAGVGAVVTLVTTSLTGAVTGFSRFLFALPVFLALVTFTDSRRDLRSHLNVMVVFYAAAAATVPLQEIVGVLTIFSEGSSRGGFGRFGSALGAVSVVATAAALVIPMIAESTVRFKWFYIVVVAGSALVSLSKVAVIAVLFGLVTYVLSGNQNMTKRTGTIVVALALGTFGFVLSPTFQQRLDVVAQEYGYTTTGEDLTIFGADTGEDAWSRLTEFPRLNYAALEDFESPLVYVIGGGYGMGGQTLVSADDVRAPQGHNQYAELVTVFGPVMAAVLIGITVRVMIRLRRNYKDTNSPLYRTFFAILGFLLIKGLFGGGAFFQPVAASALWTAMFIAQSRPLLLESRG